MVGVALVGFITIIAASTNASVEAAVDRSFRADYVIESGSWNQGFGTAIEDDLAAVDEIETMSPLRTAPVEVDGSATSVLAVDTAVFGDLYDLEIVSGTLSDVHGDGLAVQAEAADGGGLTVGDRVPVRFPDGNTPARASPSSPCRPVACW